MSGTCFSTYIHTPAAVPIYISYAMFPALVVLFCLHNFTSVMNANSLGWEGVKREGEGCCMTFWRWVVEKCNNCIVTGATHRVGLLHLLRLYILFWSIQASMVLVLMKSLTTFIIPFMFRIPYVDKVTFAYDFRVLTVQFMTIPLMVYALYAVNSRHAAHSKSNEHDQEYSLYVGKDFMERTRAIKARKTETLENTLTASHSSHEVGSASYDEFGSYLKFQAFHLGQLMMALTLASCEPRSKSFSRTGPDCLTFNDKFKPSKDDPTTTVYFMLNVDYVQDSLKQLKMWVEADSTIALCSRIREEVLYSTLPGHILQWKKASLKVQSAKTTKKKAAVVDEKPTVPAPVVAPPIVGMVHKRSSLEEKEKI